MKYNSVIEELKCVRDSLGRDRFEPNRIESPGFVFPFDVLPTFVSVLVTIIRMNRMMHTCTVPYAGYVVECSIHITYTLNELCV